MHHKPTRSLFARATYAFSGTLIGRLSAAAAGVIMARSLQAEMFGVYSALWELTLLCGSFTDTGMTVGMQREGALDKSKLGGLLGNALLVRLIIGIPALIIAYFFSSKMTAGRSFTLVYVFLAVASAAVFLSEPMYSVLQVLGKQKTVAAIESARGILSLAGIGALVILHGTVAWMAGLQGVIYIIMLVWLSAVTLKAARPSFNLSDAVSQFVSSFVYGISGLIFSLYSRIPILYLSYFKGPIAVGYYAAAYRLLAVLYVVGAGAYQRAFLPSLFGLHKSDPKAFQAAANFMQKYFLLIGFLSAACLYTCADLIIIPLMGRHYLPSVGLMRLLSLSALMNFMLFTGDGSMTAADRNLHKIFIQAGGTIFGALAGYVLIRGCPGATGAVLTDILIRAVLMISFIAYCYRNGFLHFAAISRFIPAMLLISLCAILSVQFWPNAMILRPAIMAVVAAGIVLVFLGPGYLKGLLLSYFSPKKSGEPV